MNRLPNYIKNHGERTRQRGSRSNTQGFCYCIYSGSHDIVHTAKILSLSYTQQRVAAFVPRTLSLSVLRMMLFLVHAAAEYRECPLLFPPISPHLCPTTPTTPHHLSPPTSPPFSLLSLSPLSLSPEVLYVTLHLYIVNSFFLKIPKTVLC